MFDIAIGDNDTIRFSGRLDTAQVDKARSFVDAHPELTTFDLAELEYISSAGLGVFLVAHKRLMRSGGGLKLVNVNNHIGDVLRYSGFDQLFHIELAG